MSAVVRYVAARETEIDANTSVQVGSAWVVALGEYADQGLPDVLIYVSHGVDEEGHDTRGEIARRIAAMLDGAA